MLKKLGVSKSGYYAYIKRIPSAQKKRKQELTAKIKELYEESHEIYGAPKITAQLRQKGYQVSEKLVGNIMRELGIRAHYIKPYIRTTRDCDFSSKLKNILKRKFNPNKPNAAWCTDITYIYTYEEGVVYLTSIMDLYSRKIISWKLSRSMEVEEVLSCLEEAKARRKTEEPIVMHSDRGAQFTSKKYYELTMEMITSYSQKGTPWDNACIESFHAIIKREWLNDKRIEDYEVCYRLVFEYIEGFYNTVRIHSHCNYQTPNTYEKNYYQDN